jgi:hypothetical protein
MTNEEMDLLVDALAEPIKLFVARQIEPLLRRVEQIEGRTTIDASAALAKVLRDAK